MRKRPNTLIINASDTRCGNCRAGLHPEAKRCENTIGYGTPKPPCGEEFRYVDTDYMNMPVARLRPDLEPVGLAAVRARGGDPR